MSIENLVKEGNQAVDLNELNQKFIVKALDLASIKPPLFCIDGWIGDQLTVWGGMRGVGKTTLILHICLIICGAIEGITKDTDTGEGLLAWQHITAKRRRHILYITEDATQIESTLYAYCHFAGVNPQDVLDYFHVIDAKRYPVKVWRQFHLYAMQEQFISKQMVNGKALRYSPLVVLDTQSATLEIENENSNTEVAQIIEALKDATREAHIALWIVGHIAKQNANNADTEELTMRGAGAWEGNANQVILLFKDKKALDEEGDPKRYASCPKARFTPLFSEVFYTIIEHDIVACDEFGDEVAFKVRTCELHVTSAKERAKDRKDTAKKMQKEQLSEDFQTVLDYIHEQNVHKPGVWICKNSRVSANRLQEEHTDYERITISDLAGSGVSAVNCRRIFGQLFSQPSWVEYPMLTEKRQQPCNYSILTFVKGF